MNETVINTLFIAGMSGQAIKVKSGVFSTALNNRSNQ